MGNIRRAAGLLGLTALAVTTGAIPAGAATRVGPRQFFTGVIDGHEGNTARPITIEMACIGPLRPGQTGHPVAGQTLAVHQLFPPSSAGALGYTGTDSEIGAFFNAPPPSSTGSRTPIFRHFDTTRALPTSLVLPCAGSGTVWFTPIPVVPPSRSAAVPVRFVGQP